MCCCAQSVCRTRRCIARAAPHIQIRIQIARIGKRGAGALYVCMPVIALLAPRLPWRPAIMGHPGGTNIHTIQRVKLFANCLTLFCSVVAAASGICIPCGIWACPTQPLAPMKGLHAAAQHFPLLLRRRDPYTISLLLLFPFSPPCCASPFFHSFCAMRGHDCWHGYHPTCSCRARRALMH